MYRVNALRTPSRLRAGYPTLLQWRGRYDFSRLKTSRVLPHTSMLVIECFLTRSELIKSFAIQRPVDWSLASIWDLAIVLSHMCKAPFEPLDKASLFYLSVKTVFLVYLATARRVSEVHALSMDADHLRFSNLDGSLILRTQLGFLAKNQLPSRAPDSIKIPKLSNLCSKSDNFNRMLCPVRSVKIYLNKTKSLRKHRDFSFLLKEIMI